MQKLNKVSFLVADNASNVLPLIDEYPTAVRGSSDKNRPHIRLVYQGGILSGKKAKGNRRNQSAAQQDHSLVLPVPEGPTGRLRTWSNANQGWVGLILFTLSVCFSAGAFYMKSGLREELKEYMDTSLSEALKPIREDVRKTREDIIELQAGLANLQGRLGSISGIVYRERASALGIKEPQIVSLKLAKSSEAGITQSGVDGVPYRFTFTVQEIGEGYAKLLVNGNAGSTGEGHTLTVKDSVITIPIRVGEQVNLWDELRKAIPFPKGFNPHPLWTVVIDFPVPDTAILAVGSKTIQS